MSGTSIKGTKQAKDERGYKVFIPKTKSDHRASRPKLTKAGKSSFDWRKMLDKYREEEEQEEDDIYDDTEYVEKEEQYKEEDCSYDDTCDRDNAGEKETYGNGEYEENVQSGEDVIAVQRHIVDMNVVLVGEGIILSILEEELRKKKSWTRKEIIRRKANGHKEIVEVKENVNERFETGLLSRAVFKDRRMKMDAHVQDDEDEVEREVDDKEELRKWLEEERRRLKEEEEEEEQEIHFGIAMCCYV